MGYSTICLILTLSFFWSAYSYGCVYFLESMLRDMDHTDFKGKRVLISGSGNVAQYAAYKVIELGGRVLSLSDSTGSLVAATDKGFSAQDISEIAALKLERQALTAFTNNGKFTWHEDARPWTLVNRADVAIPSATQNEISKEEAEALVRAGVRYVAEGSNMGCTQEAIEVFEATRKKAHSLGDSNICWYAPGKAANAGGVAVSGLEMAQNSGRQQWSTEELDKRLKGIMEECYKSCFEVGGRYSDNGGVLPSLQAGANIAGFLKVADAMRDQGEWW